MKSVARFFTLFNDEEVDIDGAYVSNLITPDQAFVHQFIGYDPTKEVARGLVPGNDPIFSRQGFIIPSVNTFTVALGAIPATQLDVGLAATDVQTFYLLVSETQASPPTPAEIKASGTVLPGTTAAHTVTGLAPGATYFGWVLARSSLGTDSAVVASEPASIATAPPGLIVPQNFTSAVNGGFEVLSSSVINANFVDYGVFDGVWGWQGSTWHAATGTNEWFTVQMPSPKTVTSIAWHYNSFHAPSRRPFNVRFEGWNGVGWDVLYTNQAVQYPDSTTKPNFPGTGQLAMDVADTAYDLLRFFIVSSEDGKYTHLDRFFVYGY